MDREIFPHRMAFPVRRHKDPLQVRVVAKTHAKKVEDLALIPVGGAPDGGDRIQLGSLANAHFQAEPRFARNGIDVVDNLKARLARPPIHRGHGAKAIETELLFEKGTHCCKLARIDYQRELIQGQL